MKKRPYILEMPLRMVMSAISVLQSEADDYAYCDCLRSESACRGMIQALELEIPDEENMDELILLDMRPMDRGPLEMLKEALWVEDYEEETNDITEKIAAFISAPEMVKLAYLMDDIEEDADAYRFVG